MDLLVAAELITKKLNCIKYYIDSYWIFLHYLLQRQQQDL